MRLIVLVICCLAACPLAHAQTTAESVTAQEFATFGVKLTAPADWKRQPEDGPDMMAKWSVPGALAGGAGGAATESAIVTVRLESARGKTTKSYATEMAQKIGGEARSEPSGLADDATWRIDFTKPTAQAGPQIKTALVAVHGEYIYIVTGFEAQPGADAAGAVEEVRRNWSFVDLERPSSAPGLRPEPVVMLGKLQMRPAATLRPRDVRQQTRGKAIEMQIFNWRSGRADVVMTAEVDARPTKSSSLEDLGKSLIAQMSLKQDPEKPITWKKLQGLTPRIISTSFEGAKAGSRGVPLRFALIQLNDQDVCLLGFVFPNSDKTEREIYEDMTEAMTSTVEPVKK
jgi:hypothetical protein